MLVNIHEAKTHLSKLIERVLAGEVITIGKAGKPVAQLVPLGKVTSPRQPGAWRGQVWISPDFDELPAEVADAFEAS
ncbi:MAG: type II toxin-antitoxin system Phd/YefM family antitoxin [Actinomycetota bacterium]